MGRQDRICVIPNGVRKYNYGYKIKSPGGVCWGFCLLA